MTLTAFAILAIFYFFCSVFFVFGITLELFNLKVLGIQSLGYIDKNMVQTSAEVTKFLPIIYNRYLVI